LNRYYSYHHLFRVRRVWFLGLTQKTRFLPIIVTFSINIDIETGFLPPCVSPGSEKYIHKRDVAVVGVGDGRSFSIQHPTSKKEITNG
jgi:hypothetical protein